MQKKNAEKDLFSVLCGATRNRTGDTRIFSPLLYQLSYDTNFGFASAKVRTYFETTKYFQEKLIFLVINF